MPLHRQRGVRPSGATTGSAPYSSALLKDAIEELYVLAEVARAQEVVAHAALRRLADPLGVVRVREQLADRTAETVQVTRLDQHAGVPVLDLVLDAAHARGDDGSPLPHALGHREPEPLGKALLDDHVGTALQG